jgi:hypothetical protein
MKNKEFHWQLITFFRVLFAFHLIYSGAAYVFFGWVPAAFHDPASPVGRFMVELASIGLYPVVKYIELFLGVLVLSNRWVAVAAVAELPITIIISYLNIFVEGAIDARHYYTGVQELTINGMVLLGYGAYYRTMLTARPLPRWLWQPLDRGATGDEAAAGSARHPLGTPQIWAFFAAVMVVVVCASWFMGPPDRRLPPRDWLPPLVAFASMLVLYRLPKGRREERLKQASIG